MKHISRFLFVGLPVLFALSGSVGLNFHLSRKIEEITERLEVQSKANAEAGIAVLKLSECFEPGELGPDQGCRQLVDRVARSGDRAVPFLLASVDNHDMHTVLNVFRCLSEINPHLDAGQWKKIEAIREKVQSRMIETKDSADGYSLVENKMRKLVILSVDSFLSAAKSTKTVRVSR